MKTKHESRDDAVKNKSHDRLPIDRAQTNRTPKDSVPVDTVPTWAFDRYSIPLGADIVTNNKSGPVARFFFISLTHPLGDIWRALPCASP